jgi:hypothetical protein
MRLWPNRSGKTVVAAVGGAGVVFRAASVRADWDVVSLCGGGGTVRNVDAMEEAVRCDAARVCLLVTRVRQAAETVRGYGRVYGGGGISSEVPQALLVVAACIESEMRQLISTDHSMAKLFGGEAGEADVGSVEFDLPAVPSLAVHPRLNSVIGAAGLYATAAELDALAGSVGEVMASPRATVFGPALIGLARVVRAFADRSEQQGHGKSPSD